MRSLFFLLTGILVGFGSGCSIQPVDTGVQIESKTSTEPSAGKREPVLVELFTSEGCSSCPPADRNLAFLENQQPVSQADIITLAFHVDYWDRLGWKDRFSSPLYSRRQEEYARALKLDSNYTPQMIVDGTTEFVGSDSGKATKEILTGAESAKATIELSIAANRLSVKITNAPVHRDATAYAAIAEDGISSRVERGENSGKTLEHVSVVRELKTLGALTAEKNEMEVFSDLQLASDWSSKNLKVVVFVQENESKKIVGVGRIKMFP